MNFRVRWSQTAVTELADAWVRAADKAAITRSSDELDKLLALRASTFGEKRAEYKRAGIVGKLWAYVHIHPQRREVVVRHIIALA
jgi:hypothetical protein